MSNSFTFLDGDFPFCNKLTVALSNAFAITCAFALLFVVASCSKETAKATEDISQKIEAIQNDTKSAVDAIGQIGLIINQINDTQNTIASAVEEQTATTNEITRNVTEAARGSAEIADNITNVASAAAETTAGASDTNVAAIELAKMAAELKSLAKEFSE